MVEPIPGPLARQDLHFPLSLPLPASVSLAVFDGSAVLSPTGYRWNEMCRWCGEARLVPTTTDPKDYRRCRLCRVSTVVLRRYHWARKHQAWDEAEWCWELFRCLHRHRKDWFRWTERERTRHRSMVGLRLTPADQSAPLSC